MRAAVAAAVLLTTVLAGCSGGDETKDPSTSEEPGHDDLAVTTQLVLLLNVTIGDDTYRFTGEDLASSRPPAASSTSGTVTASSGNSTTSPSGNGAAGNGTGNQTMPSGPAPLNVTFELGARHLTNATGLRWTLGDTASSGNASGDPSADAKTGTALPATVDRTYETSGSYQVTYALRLGNGTVERLNVTIVVSNGTANVTVGRPVPDVLHFEYPESLGCAGDLATCVSREGGPESSGVDGFWQELDDRYWGLTFAVTGGAAGDSDCQAFDADLAELGDFSNGGGECTGELPDGTAYLFLYSYAAPSLALTLDFTPPA